MQNVYRLITAAFVAIIITLGFGGFNSVKAQDGSAHFVDSYPDNIYLLPNEYFGDSQNLTTNDWSDRIVTFDLYVGYGSLIHNNHFNFNGCEEWLEDIGSVIDSSNADCYRANWIANDEGATWFQVFMVQFTNHLPIGQERYYMSSIGGYVRTDEGYFEGFSDYHPHTLFSIDGIRGDVNGDGEVTHTDVELLQNYCFSPQDHNEWRYTANGINVGRGSIMFSWANLVDGYLINLWLMDPNHFLVADLGIGELISENTYGYGGNSVVQPAPHSTSQIGNELIVSTDGLAAGVYGNLSDGTPWQASGFTTNGQFSCQLPDGLQNMRIEAVSLEGATAVNTPVQPTSIILEQNYPNPFNPTTTIDFSLQSASQTSLKVYDLNGQLVTTLADGQMSAGQHSINFDASSLSSGTYFYTLTTGQASQTKKMILMK